MRRVDRPPTDGLMLISLSLSTMSSGCLRCPRSLSASIVRPGAERRVTDADRDPLPPAAGWHRVEVARGREPDADAHPGAGMAAVEDVVLALAAPREAADAAELAQGVEPIPAAGEELVGVRLVPGVPHDPVARRVHDPMEGERDLDHAERARKVAARLVDGADHLLAELGGEDVQLVGGEVVDLRRLADRFEERQGNGCPPIGRATVARKYRTDTVGSPFRTHGELRCVTAQPRSRLNTTLRFVSAYPCRS